MEIIAIVLLVIISIYPYLLLVRFLRLGCKAFKKYLNEQPIYEEYEEQ